MLFSNKAFFENYFSKLLDCSLLVEDNTLTEFALMEDLPVLWCNRNLGW